jgi:hypothetical protein
MSFLVIHENRADDVKRPLRFHKVSPQNNRSIAQQKRLFDEAVKRKQFHTLDPCPSLQGGAVSLQPGVGLLSRQDALCHERFQRLLFRSQT